MSSRQFVIGRYVDPDTYVLYKEDDTIFKVIRVGEPFKIGRQVKAWNPEKVQNKNGNGTLIVCRKYSDDGKVIEEFILTDGKRGLWALTAGAARNGVFHRYRKPTNTLEQTLFDSGMPNRLVFYTDHTINETLELGGWYCPKFSANGDGSKSHVAISDGNVKHLTDAEYPRICTNQCRPFCEHPAPYDAKITGGTYMIYYTVCRKKSGKEAHYIEKIVVTPDADLEEVSKQVKKVVI